MTAAIETTGLGKDYGSTRAVAELDLNVEPGQVFGFLGPNGAGKTTTIRMLLALQRPTRGSARVLGLDPRSHAVELHARVGYLPGELALFPHMTGHQHIEWFRKARGRTGPDPAPLVERFDVVLDRPAGQLSKGNRQKVGLVLALMHEPELLVLDEPTSGLDPLMQHEFENLVREVVAAGRTVFLSSHELDEVQRLASHVAIIKEGRLVATDTVDGLRRRSPQRIDAWFAEPVERSDFLLDGVSVLDADDRYVSLQVPRDAVPRALRAVSDHQPVEVVARRADLDELFLDFYRPASAGERVPDAH